MLLLPHVCMPHLPGHLPVETFSVWFLERDGGLQEQISRAATRNNRARILSIGDDPILLYSRRLVLERDGYFVACLRSDAVIEDARLLDFDLVMLCHSVPEAVASHIEEVLWRLAPQIPVLLVSRQDRPVPSGPHEVAVSAHPVALLNAVAQQLAIQRHSGIRSQT